jgi:hypothetical protein
VVWGRTAPAFNRKKTVSKSTFKNTTKPAVSEGAAKPSNADYPVDQEEIVKQRERLRKAAAGGVDDLKSPISTLLSALAPAPVPTPQKPQAALPQPSPSTESTPKPSQAPCPHNPGALSDEINRRAPLPDAEEQAFLLARKLTERGSNDQFGKIILTLTGGAFAVSFIFLKDGLKPSDYANKSCLIAAWVFWSAAMLCALLSLYRSQLAPRHTQQPFMNKVTRSLDALAGGWFMLGLILTIVFAATNLTHESSGTSSSGSTNAITSALSTNGTVFPTGGTDATVP